MISHIENKKIQLHSFPLMALYHSEQVFPFISEAEERLTLVIGESTMYSLSDVQ